MYQIAVSVIHNCEVSTSMDTDSVVSGIADLMVAIEAAAVLVGVHTGPDTTWQAATRSDAVPFAMFGFSNDEECSTFIEVQLVPELTDTDEIARRSLENTVRSPFVSDPR